LAWYSCFQVHAEHALKIIQNTLSMRLKVHKNENFLLRFWILYYFIVSYA